MEVRAINPPSLHQPPGDYSHAVQVGNLVFVAGQIPMDKQGRIPMRDFRAQTEQVFRNLKGVLDEIGATFDDIVRERGYIVNLDMNFATFIEVSSKYRSKKLLPASTLIEVPSLVPRESMVEYEVVVALPGI
jgi:2-iminobutanoate/2-iminopropanoate deaminase